MKNSIVESCCKQSQNTSKPQNSPSYMTLDRSEYVLEGEFDMPHESISVGHSRQPPHLSVSALPFPDHSTNQLIPAHQATQIHANNKLPCQSRMQHLSRSHSDQYRPLPVHLFQHIYARILVGPISALTISTYMFCLSVQITLHHYHPFFMIRPACC